MATKIVLYACILQVNVTLKKAGSKMEHQGIKIEFIGQIGKVKLSSRLKLIFSIKLLIFSCLSVITLRAAACDFQQCGIFSSPEPKAHW